MSDDDPMPPLKDLIARTPGAQTREKALENIKARRAKFMKARATPPADEMAGAAEPMPAAELPDPPPPPKPKSTQQNPRGATGRPPRPFPPHATKKNQPKFTVIDGTKPPPKAR